VIGVFSRDRLSGALSAVHRAGFGPQARVIDGARGDLATQLDRAGLRVEAGIVFDPAALLIVVSAPGRAIAVSDLFSRLEAERVVAARRAGEPPVASTPALLTPDIRIGEEGGLADA
jgi:hypothetical protein